MYTEYIIVNKLNSYKVETQSMNANKFNNSCMNTIEAYLR